MASGKLILYHVICVDMKARVDSPIHTGDHVLLPRLVDDLTCHNVCAKMTSVESRKCRNVAPSDHGAILMERIFKRKASTAATKQQANMTQFVRNLCRDNAACNAQATLVDTDELDHCRNNIVSFWMATRFDLPPLAFTASKPRWLDPCILGIVGHG
jgi:hypothetical protein